jgi:hypothetical protein
MSKPVIIRPPSSLFFAVCFFVLLVAGLAAAAANDPWKEKDPQDWDQKDVQKILSDSPWSKQFQFGSTMDGSTGSATTAVGSAAHPSVGSPEGMRPGAPPQVSSDLSPGMGPITKYTVSWRSSRTVREALLREKELAHSFPDQARKDLAAKFDVYQISVTGSNLSAFAKETSESLAAHSYLMAKSSKEKIVPAKVVIQKSPSGNPVSILFDFPQKTAAGEPTIEPKEKSVEFAAKAGNLPLKVTFDISKMSAKEGRDL